MTCGFCVKEGRAVQTSCNTCQHPNCGRTVCTSQCSGNLTPHGEWCACSCGKVICKRHRIVHLLDPAHPASTRPCFAGVTGPESGQALEAAMNGLLLLETDGAVSDHESDAISLFLNAVSPGTNALAAELLSMDESTYRVDQEYWPPGHDYDHEGLVFLPRFFSRGALHRMVTLAGHHLALALPADDRNDESSPFGMLRRGTISDFGAYTVQPSRPSPLQNFADHLSPQRSTKLLKEIGAALAIKPPDDPTDVARWVITTTRARARTQKGLEPA